MRDLLCDPQTSGGLLLAVMPEAENEVKATAAEFGIELTAIGELVPARGGRAWLRSVNSMRLFIAEKPSLARRPLLMSCPNRTGKAMALSSAVMVRW